MKLNKKLSVMILGLISIFSNISYAEEKPTTDIREIYVAGGCFWGVEKYFSLIDGVVDTKVGYANGITENPTYETVLGHKSGYAETTHVKYDNNKVKLKTLLTQFFKIINPLSKNKQGNDVGDQYRTGVYYTSDTDKAIIQSVFDEEQKKYDKPIQTELEPLKNFYKAEEYHQQYLKKHPDGYCHIDFSSLDDLKDDKSNKEEQ